jgi:hypothetical protein
MRMPEYEGQRRMWFGCDRTGAFTIVRIHQCPTTWATLWDVLTHEGKRERMNGAEGRMKTRGMA